MATAKTRIYVVTHRADGSKNYVRAPNRVSARNHVARTVLDVTLAEQEDLLGVSPDQVVTAGEDAEGEGNE